jgi:hypothetical protein
MKRIVLVGFIVVLLLFIVWYVLLDSTQFGQDTKAISCTNEALMCPDGSFVSRVGAECRFQSCPSMISIIGKLEEDENGFRFVTQSPHSGEGEVNYVLPLQIKVSNVLEQIINRRVRVNGLFTEGNMFQVETLEELKGDSGDPTMGTIHVGESVYVNGVLITVNEIVQDSRCPSDVQCIQAGNVVVLVTLKSDTDQETIELSSLNHPYLFDAYEVTIENVTPLANSLTVLAQSEYSIVFRVVNN